MSEHCQFGETRQEMLRDRLVCGVKDTSIQRKLLAETDLTLDKALSTARAMETAERNTRALRTYQPTEETDVHNVRDRRANTAQPAEGGIDRGACTRCGAKSHTPEDCRWKSAVCHACKKRGHLARMCRSKRQQSASSTRPQQGPGAQPRSQRTHTVDTGPGGSRETPSSEDEEEVYAIFNLRQKKQPIRVEVIVNGQKLSMELDTGAALTIMSETTYYALWPQGGPTIHQSTISLKTYTGEPIKVRGRAEVQVEYNDQTLQLPILVVEGSGPTLLGRNCLHELRLDWPKIFSVQLDTQHPPELVAILEKYQAVFKDELGELRGAQAKIHLLP